jgi:hypothetical protein
MESDASAGQYVLKRGGHCRREREPEEQATAASYIHMRHQKGRRLQDKELEELRHAWLSIERSECIIDKAQEDPRDVT